MDRDAINAFAGTFPGAEVFESFGPGHDVWKVKEKMFAMMGVVAEGVSVKTDSVETSQMLIETGVGIKAPYMHKSWVCIPFGSDPDEVQHRLKTSYALIRKALTKKAQAELEPFEGD